MPQNESEKYIFLNVNCACSKHVVFGRVIKGEDVVRLIENSKTDANSRPFKDVLIANCGELVLQVKSKGNVKMSNSFA